MRFLHEPMRTHPIFPATSLVAFLTTSPPSTASPGPGPRTASWKAWARLALAGLTLATAGCNGCRSSKPYTPYTLSDAPPASATTGSGAARAAAALTASTTASAATPLVEDAGAAFPAVQGTPPPGDGKSFPLEGTASVAAPIGRTFGTGLLVDVDGDGKRDMLAWARAPDGLRGELWYAPGSKPDALRAIAALPLGLAVPGCRARADLTLVGPRAVLFDFDPRCSARARDRAVRFAALLRLPAPAADAVPSIGLELRLGVPADGETFQITIDPRDRDGDGRDDIAAIVTLAGAPRPLPSTGAGASATLAFFDRPAGLSRDPSEPEASLKAFVASLVPDGRRKATAARVTPAALSLRRLYGMLCEEAGKPRITTSAGVVRCGAPRVIEDATVSEVEAAINLGDPVSAMAALARLDAIGAHRKDVDALIAKHIPAAAASPLAKTTTAPLVELAPAFGPLAFTADADLLVRAQGQVVRVDHATFGETPEGGGIRFPTRLAAPGEDPPWRLVNIEQRCNEPTLTARFEVKKPDAPPLLDLALPVAMPPRCADAARVPSVLLGASSQGALIAVGAEVFAIPLADAPKPAPAESLALTHGAPVDLGASRSPDGGTLAIPTSRGLLVITVKGSGRGGSARLWTGLDGGASRCVPSNGGERVACVTAPAATLYAVR
jgi:hypothetical protein